MLTELQNSQFKDPVKKLNNFSQHIIFKYFTHFYCKQTLNY